MSLSISFVMHGFHNNTAWSSSSDVSGRMKHWTEANTGVHLFILSILPYSIGSNVMYDPGYNVMGKLIVFSGVCEIYLHLFFFPGATAQTPGPPHS